MVEKILHHTDGGDAVVAVMLFLALLSWGGAVCAGFQVLLIEGGGCAGEVETFVEFPK